MKNSILYISIALLSALFYSCGSLKNVPSEKLERLKESELRSRLDSLSTVDYDYFYAKIATKYHDTSMNISFKTTVRMKRDSVVNTLITYARIPVFNSLVTQDSIFIVDKREKCTTIKSIDYLKKRFTIDVELKNVEQMLLGLPLGYDNNLEYYKVNDPYNHTISSHKKREIKKNERKKGREIITYYTFSDDLKILQSQRIESPLDSTIILIEYEKRELVGDYLLPKKVNISVLTPLQEIKIHLDYRKLRINEKETIHFVIPEKYGECK
tara:strand:+ start:786 stop:1592 length:807 start_codon:yes stop_codon:yes gene_type:complete